MELRAPDDNSMVRVAVAHLAERLPTTDLQRIEETVRDFVTEWNRRARVKTFVGVIAERHAREALEATE
jgi:hypothetical protein